MLIVGALFLCIGLIQVIIYKQPLPEGQYESIGDLQIAYDAYGQGKTVVLAIHGSPGSKNDFRLLAPLLKNTTVYALDMPCFGESSFSTRCDITSASKTLKQFMDAKQIEKATVLGYSWGGGVAIEFAHHYPEKTSHLILLSGMGIQEGELTGSYEGEKIRGWFAYPFVVFYPGVFAGNIYWREGFMKSFLQSDQRPLRMYLQNFQVPTLILQATEDYNVKAWVAEEHARLIPHSTLSTYKGDHGKLKTDAREIASIINEYHEKNK